MSIVESSTPSWPTVPSRELSLLQHRAIVSRPPRAELVEAWLAVEASPEFALETLQKPGAPLLGDLMPESGHLP